ncbi:MAG TPA: VCBS repeat-containing protein, partial [Polyangiales bacterium]|nr:VCBS repeat-containing protein [Polyangiales bacterium]
SFGAAEAAERLEEVWPQAAGDLDDDGRDDLMSSTEGSSLVFYGARELHDQLSAADADALLTHPLAPQGSSLGPVASMISSFGDLDRDGMADLIVTSEVTDSVGFVYGRHWSGELELAHDFTLEVELLGKQYIAGVGTADLDGDKTTEILVSVAGYARQVPVGVYVVRAGKGERLEGRRSLRASERWIAPEQDPTGAVSGLGFEVGVSGDVDGDGGQDILTHLAYDTEFNVLPVFLIPSTPRTKD